MTAQMGNAARAPLQVTLFCPIAQIPVGRRRPDRLQRAHHHPRPQERPAPDHARGDHRGRRQAVGLGSLGRGPLGAQSAGCRPRDRSRYRGRKEEVRATELDRDRESRVLSRHPWSGRATHPARRHVHSLRRWGRSRRSDRSGGGAPGVRAPFALAPAVAIAPPSFRPNPRISPPTILSSATSVPRRLPAGIGHRRSRGAISGPEIAVPTAADALDAGPVRATIAYGDIWLKEDPREVARRHAQPRPHGRSAIGESDAQDWVKGDHPAPRRCGIRENQYPTDDLGTPTELSLCDPLSNEPDLLVELPDRLLEACELGLDLLDEDRTHLHESAHHVDRTALAIDRIRRLDPRFPPEAAEATNARGHQGGVPYVEQSIESSTTPLHGPLEASIDSREDATNRCHRQTAHAATLHIRNG